VDQKWDEKMIINGFFREKFCCFFHQITGKILEKYVFPSVNSSSNFSKIYFSDKFAQFLYHKIENGKKITQMTLCLIQLSDAASSLASIPKRDLACKNGNKYLEPV